MTNHQKTKQFPCEQLDRHLNVLKIRSPKHIVTMAHSLRMNGQITPIKIVLDERYEDPIVIDGFKRTESAVAMRIPDLECEIVGTTIQDGLLSYLRMSIDQYLHPFEQGQFLKFLVENCSYTGAQLAKFLGRSSAWVSHRVSLIDETPSIITEAIFQGRLPPSSYSYAWAKFIRDYEPSVEQLKELVLSLSGKDLSVRDIHDLCQGYFVGHPQIAEWITAGKITEALNMVRPHSKRLRMSGDERRFLVSFTALVQLTAKVNHQAKNITNVTPQFRAEIIYWTEQYERHTAQCRQGLNFQKHERESHEAT